MNGDFSPQELGRGTRILAALLLAWSVLAPAHLGAETRFIYETAPGVAAKPKPKAAPSTVAKPAPKSAPQPEFFVRDYAALDRPLDFGEHYWDESHAKTAGVAGPAQIVVDLEAEQLYVYRAGIEIARSKVTRGWEQYETPTGVFPILEKDADHYSSTYGGAPMPYNLRLTWPGVAIHGAEVDSVSATHGCIGVPLEFARQLFRSVKKGDRVLVTRNWRRDIYG